MEQPRLRVVLALCGQTFSRSFVMSLLATVHELWESQRVQVVVSPCLDAGPSVHRRMRAWGLSPHRGLSTAVPMDGDFDVLVSLGSDVSFDPSQIMELIECCVKVHPVLGGILRGPTVDRVLVASSLDLRERDQFDYWMLEDVVSQQDELRKKAAAAAEDKGETLDVFRRVAYTSLDFLALRRDVFDHPALRDRALFEFPSEPVVKKDVEARYVYSEEEALMKNLEAAGIPVHVHLGLTIGVERPVVL